jgi:O-antigen ligase
MRPVRNPPPETGGVAALQPTTFAPCWQVCSGSAAQRCASATDALPGHPSFRFGDALMTGLIFLYAIFLPLNGMFYSPGGSLTPLRISGACLILSAAFSILISNRLSFTIIFSVLPLICLLLLSGISILWTVDLPGTVESAYDFAQILIIVTSLSILLRGKVQLDPMAIGFVVGCYILMYLVFQGYWNSSEEPIARIGVQRFGDTGSDDLNQINENGIAYRLMFGACFAGYLLFSQPSRVLIWVAIVYVLGLIPAILLTGSRGGTIALGLFLILLARNCLSRIGSLRGYSRAILLLIPGAVLYVSLSMVLGDRALDRYLALLDTDALADASGRGALWHMALGLIEESWLLGYGSARAVLGGAPHNAVVDLLLRYGFFGLIVLLGATVWWYADLRARLVDEASRRTVVIFLAVLVVPALLANVLGNLMFWSAIVAVYALPHATAGKRP